MVNHSLHNCSIFDGAKVYIQRKYKHGERKYAPPAEDPRCARMTDNGRATLQRKAVTAEAVAIAIKVLTFVPCLI
jgi:hypothetical protein